MDAIRIATKTSQSVVHLDRTASTARDQTAVIARHITVRVCCRAFNAPTRRIANGATRQRMLACARNKLATVKWKAVTRMPHLLVQCLVVVGSNWTRTTVRVAPTARTAPRMLAIEKTSLHKRVRAVSVPMLPKRRAVIQKCLAINDHVLQPMPSLSTTIEGVSSKIIVSFLRKTVAFPTETIRSIIKTCVSVQLLP